jgi:integrase
LDRKRGLQAAEKATAAKQITFRECAERYIASHRAGWRSARHGVMWETSLANHVYLVIGDLDVSAIDTGLVLRVIEPLWQGRTETASRIRGRIEAVLSWATTHGYRSGDNPARWRDHLKNILPKPGDVKRVAQMTALPYPEIGAFMTELRKQDSIGARALEFTVLTATRTGEALGARWDEIDLKARTWTIPAERTKADRQHRIPLSDRAVEIVEEMAAVRMGDHVFPGRGGKLSPDTMRRELARMGQDIHAHGFRSTFRDWAAERTAYPSEIAEMALAHSVGSAVEQAYRRSDLFERRRRLMDDWANFCAEPTATEGEVIAIRAASAGA